MKFLRSPRTVRPTRRMAAFALVTALLFVLRKLARRAVRRRRVRIAQSEPFPYSAHVSGREGCDIEGLRFLAGALSPAQIQTVTAAPIALEPVRVYAGLAHGTTVAARVAYAMAELERLGAFGRSWLLVISPTGRGYVHPVPVETVELATGGDVASVTVQYHDSQTLRAINRLDAAADCHRLLLEAIHQRLGCMPAPERPKLCVYGESLGAWAGQEGLLAASDELLRSLHAGAWCGTPHASRAAGQLAARLRQLGRRVVSIEDPGDAGGAEFAFLANVDDPIVYFNGPAVLLRPQPWVRRLNRCWIPGVTLARAILDVEAATRPEPGVRTAHGHDYRAVVDWLLRRTYRLPHRDDRAVVDRMGQFLTEHERTRRARMAFLHAAAAERL